MKISSFLTCIVLAPSILSCNRSSSTSAEHSAKTTSNPKVTLGNDTVYKSDNLVLIQLSEHSFQHISFLQTHDFGRVACNGLLLANRGNALIFDTPANSLSSEELINFATEKQGLRINEVVPTHFHEDCVAGLGVFQAHRIPCYASQKTIAFLRKNGNKFTNYIHGFADSTRFMLGDKTVFAGFLGEGHTKDNIVGYFPADSVLFGGCLIKELDASKGNLEDANVLAWPATVGAVKQRFPDAKIVVPGHGKSGGKDLLDYTSKLFGHRI